MEHKSPKEDAIVFSSPVASDLNIFKRIGIHKTNYCEDYAIAEVHGQDRIVCAVMDGCSMGTDSYLASSLLGKLVRKATKDSEYQEFYRKRKDQIEVTLEKLVVSVFNDVKVANQVFRLADDELLTTLIIAVYDLVDKEIISYSVGDGLLSINNETIEYEYDNRSDYVGYHLDKDANLFFREVGKMKHRKDVTSFALSTDGILAFRQLEEPKLRAPAEAEIVSYLLRSEEFRSSPNWVQNKVDKLADKYGLYPTDDLGIVVYSKVNQEVTRPT